jgi:hypothetical protein
MDERALGVVASLDRPPIAEPPDDTSRPPSRRRLAGILAFKLVLAAYGAWYAVAAHDRVSFHAAFWAAVTVGWVVSARGTLRQLRATA